MHAPIGTRLGRCRIIAEGSKGHVTWMASYAATSLDRTKCIRKRLSQAYKQFMPDATNVILMTANWTADIEDFETVLLGTEYGTISGDTSNLRTERMPGGFWSGRRHQDSYVAGWFDVANLEAIRVRLYRRADFHIDAGVDRFVDEILGTK